MYDYPTLTIFGSYGIFFSRPGPRNFDCLHDGPCSLGQASTGRCSQSYGMYVESDHTFLRSRY